MRHTFTIFKWEMKKIIANWRKTLTTFLLPAVLLLAAINVFPLLINYLSTGHIQSRPVTAIAAPESFKDYIGSNSKSSLYSFTWLSKKDGRKLLNDKDEFQSQLEKGRVFISFTAKEQSKTVGFDDCVRGYYSALAHGERTSGYEMMVRIFYDSQSFTSYLLAEQFQADLGDGYAQYLMDELGQEYLDVGGGSRWDRDAFNPFNFVLSNRANANLGASRTIPSMMILLMYYCIYSLAAETLASSRQSGFLTKVYLTPISKHALLTGKALMVIMVGVVSALITYFMLFISSWVNRSNSAYSLLPFGLFLSGSQLLLFFISILLAAIVMTMICFAIVFKLRRMEDVIMNLQTPLVLLIFEFFGNMFRPSSAIALEYCIPVHNSIMLIREIFLGTFTWGNFAIVSLVNILVAGLLFMICLNTKDGMIHIAEGGTYDIRKSRK